MLFRSGNEVGEEGTLGVFGVVRLGHLFRDGPEFGRHETQLLALEAAHHFAGQASLDAVGLHNDKGAVHEGWTLHNGRGMVRPPFQRQRPASSQGTDAASASARAVPTT